MRLFRIFILFFFLYSFSCKANNEKVFSEFLNRRIYFFNYGIEKILFYPWVNIYSNKVPLFFKNRLRDFFKNAYDFQNFFVNIFFSNIKNINLSLHRLLINNSVGIIGFFDLAFLFNFYYEEITLDSSFYKNSFFLFLPLLGPTNSKEFIFFTFNQFFTPHLYLFKDITLYYFFEAINRKSELLLDINFIDKNMLDAYSFIKDIYIQNNCYINNISDYDDFLFNSID